MRSFVVLAITAVGAMLLQTSVLPLVPFLPVVPDLILVLTVYVGIRHPSASGACGAFVLGYFLDTFSGTILGMHAFAFAAVFAGVHLMGRNFWLESGAPVMILVFAGACLGQLASVAIATLVASRSPVWQHVLRYGLLEAGMAALASPLVFACVRWEKRMLRLT